MHDTLFMSLPMAESDAVPVMGATSSETDPMPVPTINFQGESDSESENDNDNEDEAGGGDGEGNEDGAEHKGNSNEDGVLFPALSKADAKSLSIRRRGRPPKNPQTLAVLSSSKSSSRPTTPPPLEIPKPDGTEKGQFLHDLYLFMQNIEQPITKVPHLGYQELDLHRLYQIVVGRGGMDEVTKRQEWKVVYQELGIPTMSTSASYNTRTNYKKYLYLYELEHCDLSDRKRPVGMEPKFAIGDYVRIVSPNYDGQVFYAKAIKCRWATDHNMYYVHYNGWSNSHDEWMPEEVLSELLAEEQTEPESLANPQPNRSSKSNNIIGEAAGQGEAKERTPRQTRSKHQRAYSDDEDAPFHGPRSKESTSPLTPSHGSRRLRVKLRHQEQMVVAGRGQDSDGPASTAATLLGPTISTIQEEMEKLEEEGEESFLAYSPPRHANLLNSDNLHTQYTVGPSFGFKRALLDMVDLQALEVDEIVGEQPAGQQRELKRRTSQTQSQSGAEADERRKIQESIWSLERELEAVRREYRRNKRLRDLYYGTSSSSESGSPELVPKEIPKRGRRLRAAA